MKRVFLLLVLASMGCSAQSETYDATRRLVYECDYLGGASHFEAKDGVTTRFVCQFVAPAAWVYPTPRQR